MRVERETITRYYCDYCNHEYRTKAAARKCEREHTFEATDPNGSKPKYHTGDFVYEVTDSHRWYFILDEDWKPYWDAKERCWAYRSSRDTRILEPELGLEMTASEYNRRVQYIKDKLGKDYIVDIDHYGDCVGFRVDLVQKGEQK